jgi:biopolymer transport protein ExbB/TolQ
MSTNPLVQALLNYSTSGDLVVLVILLFLSLWATALIIERFLYFRKQLAGADGPVHSIRSSLESDAIGTDWRPPVGGPFEHLFKSLWNDDESVNRARSRIKSAGGVFRRDLMRRTNILGTLGATAPFIGLLGTVFGIIQAFRDLAETVGRSSQAIMGGIAEALVATGLGLFVAIPCVLAYNYYSRRAYQAVEEMEETANWLLSVRGER